jgi:hypothetical protein
MRALGAISTETTQRISTTALEIGTKLDDGQGTVGHADPSTRLYDRHRFLPTKSAALMMDYAPQERLE